MKNVVIFAGLFTIVSIAGCGGSVEHEQFESPEFSGQRTRIHVRSHEERPVYRASEGQPIHLHVHTGNGQSVCIEITNGR